MQSLLFVRIDFRNWFGKYPILQQTCFARKKPVRLLVRQRRGLLNFQRCWVGVSASCASCIYT